MADTVSILPTEIWQIILSHVVEEDANDALSCYKTCTLFQSSLLKSRTTWMFPFIYPFLHNQLKRDLKDVKSCRLVCRSWNKGVDTYMESHHFHPICLPNRSWVATRSLSRGDCETFMAHFKGSSRNPFISRTLRLSSTVNVEFMREFGCHLHALVLRVSQTSVTKFLKQLWDILECVPSVKYLELVGLDDLDRSEESDGDVQKFLATHDPPKVPHLVFLNLHWFEVTGRNYFKLRNIFIEHFQSRQVTILYEYDPSPWSLRRTYKTFLHLGWNMRTLSFNWNSAAPYFQQHTLALTHINFPLESLEVSVECLPNIDQLFAHILKFKHTLRSLTIRIYKYRSACIQLPAASESTSSAYSKYFSYINQLEKLERLDIRLLNENRRLTATDLKTLAQSVFMEHWPEYRRAGERGRRIDITLFAGEGAVIVNLLKGQRGRQVDDEYYPLCHQDFF